MTAMEQMKAAAKDLSDYLGFTPPIPVDDIEEEDLKSELLEAATQLVETDTLARSTARTLGEIGAVMPEGIEIVDDEPVEEPGEKPKPKKQGSPVAKGKAPAKKVSKEKEAKQEPKEEKPNPKKPASTPPPPVTSRAGRANTMKRREYMATLIREGKWTHRQIVMKVAGQFPEYSPLTVITDLANAGSPDYCFYENVVGQKPTGELYFTKEKGNGRYYYGTKAEPRGPARKKEPKAKKETPKAAPKKAPAKKEAAKKEKPAPKKAAAKPKKEAKPKAVSKKKEAPKKESKKKAPAKKAAPKKKGK